MIFMSVYDVYECTYICIHISILYIYKQMYIYVYICAHLYAFIDKININNIYKIVGVMEDLEALQEAAGLERECYSSGNSGYGCLHVVRSLVCLHIISSSSIEFQFCCFTCNYQF
jgi:hypothetical protein